MEFRLNALRPLFLQSKGKYRFYSTESPKKKTVFLPKSNFVNHIKSTERALSDQQASISGDLSGLYEWQLNENSRKTFELLDGPPYANGEAHTGHAINKILKDFVVKSRIGLGYRVLFRPGWDCHGLPIELKISKNLKNLTEPLEIRSASSEVATGAIGKQMNAFKRWGVTADWNSPYLTKSEEYVSAQLRVFGDLVEKGLVYRSFKPVYWSPSSNTALAESELEYNEKHTSISAYFRFKFINLHQSEICWLKDVKSKPTQFYALTWTTTPWTLPLNNAICVSPNFEYCVVQLTDEINNPTIDYYLIAKNLVESFITNSKKNCEIVGQIQGDKLIGKRYKSCWHNELALPVLRGDHVMDNVGTGLVHTSFAHGFQDYDIAVEKGEEVESFVDSRGCYTRHMGHDLFGKDVLGEGQKEALKMLKNDVVHTSRYVHSYPYDWRTKKPVIIRSSEQWFMNIGEIGRKAATMVDGIKVSAGDSDLRSALKQLVTTRKTWCISRQRVWGTPIPALIDDQGKSYVSKELIHHVASMIMLNGTDWWWKCEISDILTKNVRESLKMGNIDESRLVKNADIMDVWLDSGLAWAAAKSGYKYASEKNAADVVLEGVDQFRGWFQSLLLTSVAATDSLPYKQIVVHGFCVDEKNNKMSKSIGNVVDPVLLTDGSLKQKAIGADGLRFWVSLSGAENAGESKIGPKIIEDVDKKVISLRNAFRFMIGASNGYDGRRPEKLRLLDQEMLRAFDQFLTRCMKNYEELKYRTVANELIQFVNRNFSANYVKYVRDRLYCDKIGSDSHLSAQYTLHKLSYNMAHLISPLLPHLSAEVLNHLPGSHDKKILRITFDQLKSEENFSDMLTEYIDIVSNVRKALDSKAGTAIDTSKKGIVIKGPTNVINILDEIDKLDELTELLNVSIVKLELSGDVIDVELVESELKYCERCRKHTRNENETLCSRCYLAIN